MPYWLLPVLIGSFIGSALARGEDIPDRKLIELMFEASFEETKKMFENEQVQEDLDQVGVPNTEADVE